MPLTTRISDWVRRIRRSAQGPKQHVTECSQSIELREMPEMPKPALLPLRPTHLVDANHPFLPDHTTVRGFKKPKLNDNEVRHQRSKPTSAAYVVSTLDVPRPSHGRGETLTEFQYIQWSQGRDSIPPRDKLDIEDAANDQLQVQSEGMSKSRQGMELVRGAPAAYPPSQGMSKSRQGMELVRGASAAYPPSQGPRRAARYRSSPSRDPAPTTPRRIEAPSVRTFSATCVAFTTKEFCEAQRQGTELPKLAMMHELWY